MKEKNERDSRETRWQKQQIRRKMLQKNHGSLKIYKRKNNKQLDVE